MRPDHIQAGRVLAAPAGSHSLRVTPTQENAANLREAGHRSWCPGDSSPNGRATALSVRGQVCVRDAQRIPHRPNLPAGGSDEACSHAERAIRSTSVWGGRRVLTPFLPQRLRPGRF